MYKRQAYAYSIDKLQDRGRFFISPMEQVYEGQVIGEHTRQNDITVNVTKAKQLTNMRASGSDEKTSIAPPKVFSLEEALEYIKEDEYCLLYTSKPCFSFTLHTRTVSEPQMPTLPTRTVH